MGLIYLSARGAVDPKSNRLVLGTIEEETEMALENMRIVLEEAGSSLQNMLKVTVYLLDMEEYDRFKRGLPALFQNRSTRENLHSGGKASFRNPGRDGLRGRTLEE